MPDLTLDQIRREAQTIQNYLEITISGGINEMTDRLQTLGIYYARSGAMHARIIGIRDSMVAKAFRDEKEVILSLSPSLASKLITGFAAEANRLERWINRINASCKAQCDNLRTLISYEKEQLSLERKGY